jgi:acetyltransferase-like isoleucine patch superfamily enzyme
MPMLKIKRIFIEIFLRWLNRVAKPRMINGFLRSDGVFLPEVRVSNKTFIGCPEKLRIENNVFIGHYNYIEASHGIVLGEGCQLTNFISMTTHSSHISIRLYGREYADKKYLAGYVSGGISLGEYTFVGPHVVIMPNTNIGRGSLIFAYSLVKGDFPEFSIISGNPAKRIGDTREMDKPYLDSSNELKSFYNDWTQGDF